MVKAIQYGGDQEEIDLWVFQRRHDLFPISYQIRMSAIRTDVRTSDL